MVCEGRSGDLDVRFGGPWWGQEPRQGGLACSSLGILQKEKRVSNWQELEEGGSQSFFVCVFLRWKK